MIPTRRGRSARASAPIRRRRSSISRRCSGSSIIGAGWCWARSALGLAGAILALAADQAGLSRVGHARSQSARGRDQRRADRASRTTSPATASTSSRPRSGCSAAEPSPSAPRRNSTWRTIPTSCRRTATPRRGCARQPARRGGLKVIAPEEGQLIKFSYDSTSPQLAALVANGVADSFINTSLQRRYEASAYARNFLERQINKTRSDLEQSERALVAYAQQQGIINTGGSRRGRQDRRAATPIRLQGESLVQLNNALGRRDRAAGRGRRRLSPGARDRPDERRQQQRAAASPGAREAAERVSAEAHVHEARSSGDAEPPSADRRAAAADRSAESRRHRRAASMACWPIIAAALSAEQALAGPGRRSSRAMCSICAAAASSTPSCSARWTPTAASTMRCSSAISRSASPAGSAWRRSRSSIAPSRRHCRSSRTCCSTCWLASGSA